MPRRRYRVLFPPGFCALILAIRPADTTAVWVVTILLAAVLLLATPLFAALAHIWFGPENPGEFGSGRASARIFNGGDAVYAISYTLLAIASAIGGLALGAPVVAARCCRRSLPPSRLSLLRLWSVVRCMLVVFALVAILQEVS